MKIHYPNITGSAIALNGFTGSLLGTASYAATASYALNGGSGGDFVNSSWTGSSTSQFSGTASFATSASRAISSSFSTTSSFSLTASYAANAGSTFNSTSSIIGNGLSSSFSINHGFNTRNLHITVYESSSNSGETVYPDVRRINENTASVIFANPPSLNQYIVYISQ